MRIFGFVYSLFSYVVSVYFVSLTIQKLMSYMVLTHSVIFQWLVVLYPKCKWALAYPVYFLTLPQTCVFSPLICVNGFYSNLINCWMPSISTVHSLCYRLKVQNSVTELQRMITNFMIQTTDSTLQEFKINSTMFSAQTAK
jgi:hypothetical protein